MITLRNIRSVKQAGVTWKQVESVKAQLVGRTAHRDPYYLTREDLEPILTYKLRTQRGRTEHHRKGWTEERVRAVTSGAFGLRLEDVDLESRARAAILTSLSGVGIAVASAILALVEPDRYGIIDFRNWRQLFPSARRTFSIDNYCEYMAKLRDLSDQLQWPVQRVEWCIWEYDRTTNPIDDE